MIDNRIFQQPLQVQLIRVELAQKLLVGLPDLLWVIGSVVDGFAVMLTEVRVVGMTSFMNWMDFIILADFRFIRNSRAEIYQALLSVFSSRLFIGTFVFQIFIVSKSITFKIR